VESHQRFFEHPARVQTLPRRAALARENDTFSRTSTGAVAEVQANEYDSMLREAGS